MVKSKMNKIYSLLGLCQKAGKIVSGEVGCEAAIKNKTAKLLLLAEDASENTKKKFQNSYVIDVLIIALLIIIYTGETVFALSGIALLIILLIKYIVGYKKQNKKPTNTFLKLPDCRSCLL